MKQTPHQQFDALYTQYRASVYQVAMTLLKNAASAEDVMQEVFLSLYQQLTQPKGGLRHPRGWLLTATRNRCLNYIRDHRHEVSEQMPMPEAAAEEDIEEQVIGQLLMAHLLESITEEENLIFSLHCLDGYTYREIAKGLDMPMGTVQTKCRSARKKLKSALAGDTPLPKSTVPDR